jgi:hypothetical protein
MPDDKVIPASPDIEFQRAENFISLYSNNVNFEPTAWDIKIVFGQLDLVGGKGIARQQVAITIPWAQAKLALYYLRLQVAAMEMQSGKIAIRRDLIPPEPPQLTPEQEAIPSSRELRDLILKIREEYLTTL